MSRTILFACAVSLSLAACGGAGSDASADPNDPGNALADPDGKADSASSALLPTTVLNAAKQRVYARLTHVPGSSTTSLLVAAAKRGVDVQVYLVQTKPASADVVLAAQHLEASGVHLIADRSDRIGFDAVVDGQIRTLKSSGTVSVSSSATKLKSAVAAFQAALSREPAQTPRKIEADTLRLRVMPDDTGSEILDLIAGASSSIDLEIYQVEDPAITQELVSAAGRNVKVRVMLEPKTVGARNYDAEVKALKAAGIDVQPTPPAFDSSGNVDHAKFMILDGAGLAYGTGNLVCSGQGGNPAGEFNNRDYWIEDGRADSVTEAQALFDADWSRQSSSDTAFQNLVVTPDDADSVVLDVIDGAKQKLYVENQSINDPTVLEHLIAAKKNHVDVHVLVGLQPGFGGKPPANQPALDQLEAAGIPAAFFSRHYLHAKLIVADDQAFVGSQNFTAGGLVKNRELGGIISDEPIVQELEQTFLEDEASPTP